MSSVLFLFRRCFLRCLSLSALRLDPKLRTCPGIKTSLGFQPSGLELPSYKSRRLLESAATELKIRGRGDRSNRHHFYQELLCKSLDPVVGIIFYQELN
ncbi:hypothetical protein ACFX10_032227 [Malus domestica]